MLPDSRRTIFEVIPLVSVMIPDTLPLKDAKVLG